MHSTLRTFCCAYLLAAAPACGPAASTSNGGSTSGTADPCSADGCDATVTPTSSDLLSSGGCPGTGDICQDPVDLSTSSTAAPTTAGETTCPGTAGPCDTDTSTGIATETDPPPPAGCGDLSVLWSELDPDGVRGEAVAVGGGRVSWLTSTFATSHLRVRDLDGAVVWDVDVDLEIGEADGTRKDLTIDADGGIVVVGSRPRFVGAMLWYASDGALLDERVDADTEWNGVALLADGSIVAAGAQADDIRVRRHDPAHAIVWSQSFAEMGARTANDVFVTPDQRILVAGHSNANPGPVVLAYDADGGLQWQFIAPAKQSLDLALGVTVDGAGRAFVAVTQDAGPGGRVDRFSPDGALEATFAVDFQPAEIAVDHDDNLVVVGRRLQDKVAVVRRVANDGTFLHTHERPGVHTLGVAIDADCHTYAVGIEADGDGAWLEKLN